MKKFIKLLVIPIAVFFLGSCGKKEIVWTTYTSNEGGFTIVMPKNFDKTDKIEQTLYGKQMCHTITWKPTTLSINKFLLFQVTYFDCPQSTIEDTVVQHIMLDSSIRKQLNEYTDSDGSNGTQAISLNGYPGRAFIFDLVEGKAVAIVKICVVNGKEFDLKVIAKRNYATNEEVDNFFNSFKSFR